MSAINPYESPALVEEAPRSTLPNSVRAPALGLIVLSVPLAVCYALHPFSTLLMWLLGVLRYEGTEFQWIYTLVALALLAPTLVILYGALNARRGTRYLWAL